MINIFERIKFKYKFREYQKRVLNDIHNYIDDDKINIIAAPGAGKTILAIQIMADLGKPTLILTPTIALREQWIDRLKNDFECDFNIDEYVSDDIFEPNIITVTTYQSLYSIYTKKMEKNQAINIIQKLSDIGVKTIILDEAHHLKKGWLNAINVILENVNGIKTLSLTATPPYDVETKLWNNYIELCGESDVEVTVGELVKKKDLAPHQDYIFFNNIDKSEAIQLEECKQEIKKFIKKLLNSSEFIVALSTSTMIMNSSKKIQYISENFECYIAILKLLRIKKIRVPETSWNQLTNYIITIDDIEKILEYVLFKDKEFYNNFKGLYKKIKSELNKLGAIDENNEVHLRYTKSILNLIVNNVGKLNSICEILSAEKQKNGERLRAVVIAEKIGKESLLLENCDIKSMGVIPIFKNIIEKTEITPIVLTGEIIIVPLKDKELLLKICEEKGIRKNNIEIEELVSDFDYVLFKLLSSDEKSKVNIVTELYEKSNNNVLIGTNALIGEGWDAPFINTIIMASSISAYVTSNQIRGRVIRKYKLDENKCANIWHLVSVERKDDNNVVLGKDYELLKKRFEAFEGIDINGKKISYGIERLNIQEKVYDDSQIKRLNDEMLYNALDRANTIKKWENSLKKHIPMRKNNIKKKNMSVFFNNPLYQKDLLTLYNEIKMPIKVPGEAINSIAIVEMIIGIMIGIMIIFPIHSVSTILAISTFLLLAFLRKLLFKIKSISTGEIEILGKRLLATLKQLSLINKSAKFIFDKENLQYYLKKANLKENNLFKVAFNELLNIIDNPRYLITNGKRIYQVPSIIAKNRKNVETLYYNIFKEANAGIIYTGNEKGKETLIMLKVKQDNMMNNVFDFNKTINKVECFDNEINDNNKIIENVNIDINIMKNIIKSKNNNKEEN